MSLQTQQNPSGQDHSAAYLWRYFGVLFICLFLAVTVILPYSFFWLHASGDSAVERAVEAQASGQFALFGSGVSQDFFEYKLQLYAATHPAIIAIGSSRVMQFRGGWFRQPFLNLGGVAGNLAVLRAAIDSLLAIAPPKAVILGLDFWWFLPQWEARPEKLAPPTSGSYSYSLANLKKPWDWLLEGKISLVEFARPILSMFGQGFRQDRFGILAQQTNDGFGPDGSWYYTAFATGQKAAPDYRFADTLTDVSRGIRAFYHAGPDQTGPAMSHVDVLAEIWCKLKSRNIQIFAFIPPLAGKVFESMTPQAYPHLHKLREALLERGIDALDFSNPRQIAANDCEFVDGFHGGEVVYARILRQMADRWPALLAYVNMARLDAVIRDWQGHALVPDRRLTNGSETDFLGLGCQKRKLQ